MTIARTLQFWAVATLLGGGAFMCLLRQPSCWAIRLLRGAAILAGLSGAAWFGCVYTAIMGDVAALLDRDAWQTFLTAPFGPPWGIRLALCGISLGLGMTGRAWLFAALGLAFAIDQAWLGHAATAAGADAFVQLTVYWMHVVAGFLWTGALVMLCAISFETKQVPSKGLSLFSTIGIAVVVILVASGLANARFRGVTPADLLSTAYGRLVATKLVLATGMVALAVANRRRTQRGARVRATLWLETVLGLVVLVAAAALGTTPPPQTG